jgi:hypothetical protein
MSSRVKFVDDSDNVKVMVSVSPDFSVPEPLRAKVTVGAVVSIVTERADDVEVTVESERIVVETAVIDLDPDVSTPVSQVHSPVVVLAGQVFPVMTPSTYS